MSQVQGRLKTFPIVRNDTKEVLSNFQEYKESLYFKKLNQNYRNSPLSKRTVQLEVCWEFVLLYLYLDMLH